MYKALFFDVDDTLLDFSLCSHAALSKTFNDFNMEYNDTIYKLFYDIDNRLWLKQKQELISVQDVLNLRFKQLFSCLNLDTDNIAFQSKFQINLSKEHALEPGAIEIIQYLNLKYKLYVTSNGILSMQLSRLKLAGLLPYFSDLFVSDDIGYSKPNVHFFNECLKRCNLHSNEILFVGDSLEADMLGANYSDIDACWYNPYHKVKSVNVKTHYMIKNLLQLKNIL